MKKLITPIIYALFLFLLTGISVASEMLAQSFGWLPEYTGYIDIPRVILMGAAIVLFGIPIYWLANRLLRRIEKPTHRSMRDHFRQSIIYYLIVIFIVSIWIKNGFSGNEDDTYLLIWLTTSAIAILANYVFLAQRNKV